MHKIEAPVTDIFSSIQGEGLFVGARQIFVRFKDCNMDCIFCDEDRDSRPHLFTPASLMARVAELEDAKAKHHSVSLTGGEPLLCGAFLAAFLPLVRKSGMKSYLETNGTLPGELERVIDLIDIIAMDFKLPSSTGCQAFWEEHRIFLKTARRKKTFVKAVVTPSTTAEDIEKAARLILSVDGRVPFILQPATAIGKGARDVSADMLLGFLEIAGRNSLENIRVIPQVHKVLGLK